MTNLARILAALVLLALSSWAQASGTPEENFAQCQARAGIWTSVGYAGRCVKSTNPQHAAMLALQSEYQQTGTDPWTLDQYFVATSMCTAPEEFDYTEGVCVDKNAQCLALNEQEGFDGVGTITRPFKNRCMANGCNFGLKPGTTSVSTTFGGDTWAFGEFSWTGKCETPTEESPETVKAPEVEKPLCQNDTAKGIAVCQKKDGSMCYSNIGNERATCFGIGETGTKTDGPLAIVRGPGTADPPAPTPKPDDTLDKIGGPTTTTATKDPGGTTIITTTSIYETDSGADAGDNNDGEPMDGDDEGEASEGEAGGGGNCDPANKPWFVGGDQTLKMIATQAWETRCAVEAGNAAKVTGDITKCSETFSVEGTNANAVKLRAMRKQICGDETTVDVDSAGTDGTYGTGDQSGVEGGVRDGVVGEGIATGAEGLDDAGFGWSRTCPVIEPIQFMGQTITLPTDIFCDWMQLGGQFVLLMAALASLRILGGPM